MKRIVLILFLPAMVFLLTAFYPAPVKKSLPDAHKSKLEIPANVNQVIQRACYGCHSMESKNLKGKKKLDFDKLTHLKTYKLVGKLQDIADVLKENKMPPKKFVARHPEKALTPKEKETLSVWVSAAMDKLAN